MIYFIYSPSSKLESHSLNCAEWKYCPALLGNEGGPSHKGRSSGCKVGDYGKFSDSGKKMGSQ